MTARKVGQKPEAKKLFFEIFGFTAFDVELESMEKPR